MRVADTAFAAAKVKMNIFSDIKNAVVRSAYLTSALPMYIGRYLGMLFSRDSIGGKRVQLYSRVDASGTHPTAVRYSLQKRLLVVCNRQRSNIFCIGCFVNDGVLRNDLGTRDRKLGVMRGSAHVLLPRLASFDSGGNTDAPARSFTLSQHLMIY